MKLAKYHGCGNDFLLSEESAYSLEQKKHIVRHCCNRHIGIGADGFIFVHSHPLTMEFYNCDGSEAAMCGNGIRCFVRYALEHGLVSEDVFGIYTKAGKESVTILSKAPFQVSVNLGHVSFDPSLIGIKDRRKVWAMPISIHAHSYQIDTFFIGTIHTVLMVEDAFSPQWTDIGKAICEHPFFSQGTNVDFVEVVNAQHLRMSTYERGVGMSMACGTGCCAAVYAAWKHGAIQPEATVEQQLDCLRIRIDEQEQIHMIGGAEHILEGVIDLTWLEKEETAM